MDKPAVHTKLRCPQCSTALPDYPLACADCGLDLKVNDIRPQGVLATSINRNEQSIFFYVSPLKLVVMSTVTFGFYELFWFYKNWCYVQEHTDKGLMPLVRAILRIITYYGLLLEIKRAGEVQGIPCKFSPGLIAGLYFVLNIVGFVAVLGPLTLVPAQKYINQLNTGSPTPINSKFTAANWIAIVIWILIVWRMVAGWLH